MGNVMSDIDKRLEEKMAARSGEVKYLCTGLLHARRALEQIYDRYMISFDEYNDKWAGANEDLPALPPAQARAWNTSEGEKDARIALAALDDTELARKIND